MDIWLEVKNGYIVYLEYMKIDWYNIEVNFGGFPTLLSCCIK